MTTVLLKARPTNEQQHRVFHYRSLRVGSVSQTLQALKITNNLANHQVNADDEILLE